MLRDGHQSLFDMPFLTPAERHRLELEKTRPKSKIPPPLSAIEEREIAELFQRLDADGSGELDAKEIEQVQRHACAGYETPRFQWSKNIA